MIYTETTAVIIQSSAVMRALQYSVAIERKLAKKAKTVFLPILNYDHETWVLTERIRRQVQTSKIRFCESLKELRYLTKFVALKFENLWVLSRYFSESKHLSLDDLTM